ncbi:c-type cytochrome [Sulfurimonas sp.]|uniref:c-type cytochrome n=1 Tax=Sulfurimonas sp. TaxID=2022749 RepID=UPI0026185E2C|nr:c-type cytochrome [Sulfurimonas sp.]
MKLLILGICLTLTAHLLYASESAYEQGRDLYFQNGCANCHGTNAEGSSYYPKLANKKKKYLTDKLENFKKGIANTQKQEIMFTFAQTLTQKDIMNITSYLTNFKKDNSDKYNVEEDLLGVDY